MNGSAKSSETAATGRLLVSVLLGAGLLSVAGPAAGSITKGPWVQRVTSSSAVIRVEVDPPSPITFTLVSGSEPAQDRSVEVRRAQALQTVPIDGLDPAKRYTYRIRAGTATKEASFVTAPRDDSDAPFHFLVYGDNRTDNAAHAAVVRAMVSTGADFLIHTGDFVDNGSSPANWQTFFDIEAPLLSARCIYSCVGNHELIDGAGIEYTRFFGPTDPPAADGGVVPTRPEHLDGTFRWGNTRFFLINGMVSYAGSADRVWLEKALTDADTEANLKWRIVVVHHGLWSSGPHGNNARLHDAGISQLLEDHKVDLVISGHDHIYERGFGGRLAYLVSGGGGAPTYKIKSTLPQTRKSESVRHFVDIGVEGSSMRLVATRSDGSTIERCGLAKGPLGWDCDKAPTTAPAPTPPSPSPARCSCDAVGARSDAPVIGWGAFGVATLATIARRRRIRGARRLASRHAPSILR